MVHPVNLDVAMAVLVGAVVTMSMVATVVRLVAVVAEVLRQAAGQLMGVQGVEARCEYGPGNSE